MHVLSSAAISALFSCTFAGAGYAQTVDPFIKHTYVYKTVSACTIELDVIEARGQLRTNATGAPRPALVHMHGGALINGSRESITGVVRRALEDLVLERDHVLVSIDYRLAPESKLPAIVTDLQEAFKWVRDEGPARHRIDPERVAAVGSSAGGFLALTAGFRLEQRPRAIVSVSGYGAFGPWAVDPGRFDVPLVTLPEALACIGRDIVSNGVEDRPCHARDFYIYGRQQGQGFWPRSVTGFDPLTNPGAYFPLSPVDNVSKDFPPTLLVHGDLDLDVPHTESVQMAAALAFNGVEHVLNVVPGAGHNINGVTPQEQEAVSRQMFEFLRLHLEAN